MKKVTFKQKCIENNINYNTAKGYKLRHSELTNDQIIEYYKQSKINQRTKSFRQMCIENDVNYKVAINYRSKHPELTDEQVVIYYRHDLRLNTLGEII